MECAVIKLDCPQCGKHYEVNEADVPVGKWPRCGRCKTRIPFDVIPPPKYPSSPPNGILPPHPQGEGKIGEGLNGHPPNLPPASSRSQLKILLYSILAIPAGVIMFAVLAWLVIPSEPAIAGSMSQTSICQTAGYLIRLKLGKAFKTLNVPCRVETDGTSVIIHSGYISPLNNATLSYTASGYVVLDKLTLVKIKVHGIDDVFKEFSEFP